MPNSTVMTPGSVALVTGASSGIGRAVADELLDQGVRVICLGRRETSLQESFGHRGDMALCLALDVTDAEFATKLATALPENWRDIDILIASAGSDAGGRQRFDQGDMEDWAQTIETNVTGLIRVCHAILPGMLERGCGHIVTLGSVSGLTTYTGGSIYASSKHAVHALTDCLRKDFPNDPVRITEILPGLVRTGFAEARHKGDSDKADAFYDGFPAYLSAEDVAGTVMFALNQPDHVNIAQIVVTPSSDK